MSEIHPSGIWVIVGSAVASIGVGYTYGIGEGMIVAGLLAMLIGAVGDFDD